MQVRVREFESCDGDAVRAAVKAVYDEYGFTWDPDDYHADLYSIEETFITPNSKLWVGEVDGEVVGCVGFVKFDKPIGGELGETILEDGYIRVAGTDCELVRLYVNPYKRKAGLGTLLTEKVVQEARIRGCRAMELWSDKRFEAAHRLYGRFGARIVGDRICDDPDESPEYGLLLMVN